MVYSTKFAIERTWQNKEKKLMKQARDQHPDVKLAHPDFCRDAAKGQYTLLKTYIKQQKEKHIKQVNERHAKLGERK